MNHVKFVRGLYFLAINLNAKFFLEPLKFYIIIALLNKSILFIFLIILDIKQNIISWKVFDFSTQLVVLKL